MTVFFSKEKIFSSCFLLFHYCIGFSQVGIGTNNPNEFSVLELKSTSKGFLLPRMTKSERNTISPVEGLGVYCLDCVPKGLYAYNGLTWNTSNGTSGGYSEKDDLEYGTVTSLTGKVWLDRNLGATQVATSSADPNSYGDLYQWGRATDGHEKRTAVVTGSQMVTTKVTPTNYKFYKVPNTPFNWISHQLEDTLWQGIEGLNNPCPFGFRIPTETELTDEVTLFEASNNSNAAFNSILRLPSAGRRIFNTGNISNVGTTGYYWTSSINTEQSRNLSFSTTNNSAILNDGFRANGYSIRCIKE